MKIKTSPFYSIIIPHYNAPYKLRRLLKSIPRRDDLQILVIDDASSNDLSEYESVKRDFSYVEFYSTEFNGGGGKARNIGLKNATGKYIIFADSDDYFTEELSQALERHHQSEDEDIIFCNAYSFFEGSSKRSMRTNHLNYYINVFKVNQQKGEKLLRYGFGEPWAKIIKRSMLTDYKISFDELPIHNDTRFSYLIGTYARKITCDDVPIYCVTDSPKSVSKTINWEHLKIRAQVFAKKEQHLRKIKEDFSDPITYTPLFIALLNLKIGIIKDLLTIYTSCDINYIRLMFNSAKALLYYISHRLDRVYKYLYLR